MTIFRSIPLRSPKAPNLLVAPVDYRQQYVDQLNNALRLYFNQIDNTLAELIQAMSGTVDNPTYVTFPPTNVDAFNRLSVAQPFTLFDSQNRYAIDGQFDTSTASGGSTTYLSNESTVQLNVTTTSGSEVVRQTYRTMPYQPGKGLGLYATFTMNAGKTGLRQRVGYFNTQNGVFLQQNDNTLSFVLRSYTSGAPVETVVNQADWNGDRMDGTGSSGRIIDVTKTQILGIDFEWLGVGDVRCGFFNDGKFIVCHTFHNDNVQTAVYMSTAILPVRYEITNTSTTASNSSMKQICSTVYSSGGYEQKTPLDWARRTATLTGVTTTFVPIVSIRLKSTSLGAVVIPSVYHAIPIGSTLDYEVALIKNATLTGPSWISNSTNVQVDTTATAMTGGTIVSLDYVSGSNQGSGVVSTGESYNFSLQLGSSLTGVSDIYTLAARTISGIDDIIGSMSYYDLTD
jgi:hypothetical protein